MGRFRVIYRQGSFRRSDVRGTRHEAVLRALSLIVEPGVHHIRVEDETGRTIVREGDLETQTGLANIERNDEAAH